MKKIIIIVIALAVILASGFCFYNEAVNPGVVRDAAYSSEHKSENFTDEEINNAIEAVKKKFRDFEGCTLTEIYYDEEKSKSFAKRYIENGRGSVNGVTAENVIVLLSSFTVDENGGDGSLNAGGNYTGWNWILIRADKNADWVVDDWGY